MCYAGGVYKEVTSWTRSSTQLSSGGCMLLVLSESLKVRVTQVVFIKRLPRGHAPAHSCLVAGACC